MRIKKWIIGKILKNNEWRRVVDNVDNATKELMAGKISEGHFILTLPNPHSGHKSNFRIRIRFDD